jgi:hypothetical protein
MVFFDDEMRAGLDEGVIPSSSAKNRWMMERLETRA